MKRQRLFPERPQGIAPTMDALLRSRVGAIPCGRPARRQILWAVLLTALLVGVIATPVGANSRVTGQTAQRHDSATSVNAIVYITSGTLAPLFQSRINQTIPTAFNSAINGIVGNLPKQDQGWALQMASALIQPSASLISLTTQANGLAMTMSLSLYPGDPQPTIASMLIGFSVLNASTVQVSAQSLNGSPALMTGPLATFQLPLGQLNSIGTTPTCGHSALAAHLQFPIALGQGQTTSQVQLPATSSVGQNRRGNPLWLPAVTTVTNPVPTDTNSYIELPASSLAAMGSSIGSLPVSSSLTAKNIQIGVQGSDLTLNSDIYDSFWGKIGTATTTLAPTASNGSLAVTVLSTTITIFGIFTFPYNSYNQQIQQTINSKLNSALSGKFTVTQAGIGPTAAIPCAASNSLLLGGAIPLG